MIDFLEHVKSKIKSQLNPEKILVIDNTYLHKKHKSFQEGRFHLKLILESSKLKGMPKIESNRIIFSILKEELESKIPSLQIEIK